MAIVSVERQAELSGEESASNNQIKKTLEWGYTVEASEPIDEIDTILAEASIIAMGDSHPTKSEYKVVSRSVKQNPDSANGHWFYEVSVKFETQAQEAAPPGGGSPPAESTWSVEMSVDSMDYTEPAYVDLDDETIQNSAKRPYENGVEQEFADESVTYTFKTTKYSYVTSLRNYLKKINVSDITLPIYSIQCTADTLKLHKATWGAVYEGGSYYYKVTMEFHIAIGHTWLDRVVDMGVEEWIDTEEWSDWRPIRNAEGEKITTPTYLNGMGQKLESGDAQFKTYRLRHRADFTNLLNEIDNPAA